MNAGTTNRRLTLFVRIAAAVAILFLATRTTQAQLPPEIGYMHPAGGTAGQTVDVILGGYEWTPDMQVFLHDPRIKLEIVAAPGPVIVPEPPYWFGKKARRGPFPLPRETRARLTIPADIPAGLVAWQVANANGASAVGRFEISTRPEIVETGNDDQPQLLSQLPVTVSGQIKKIAEVDRYRFTATATGLLHCAVVARAIGSDLNAVLEVHDASGRLVASRADTAGIDTTLTFVATAAAEYVVSVYDVDFRGNRAYVYRLSLRQGPRVVAAIPAAGRRGETRPVEFVGYGVATGAASLESVTRDVTFPADPQVSSFSYRLETPQGVAEPFTLAASDLVELVEPAAKGETANQGADAPRSPELSPPLPFSISPPGGVTGTLAERYGEDRYQLAVKKGEIWDLAVSAVSNDAPLDVVLAIQSEEGTEPASRLGRVASSDDMPGTTDAALQWTAPADGNYQLVVSDVSGNSGNRASVYRLTVQPAAPGYSLSVPEFVNAPIGGKGVLKLAAVRGAGFKDPIKVSVSGLPPGVTVPAELAIAAGQAALNIELSVAADAPASAALVTVTGEATINEKPVPATAGPVLVATTIKPPFSVDAEGKDDVTKWPRGTTFPGPVLIEREEGFHGEIVLEMSSKQGRHRQGIAGPELVVADGVTRVLYPIFLPEWLETTRTSRMVVNGVAKVTDPKGNVRYSVSKLKTRIGFLPTGALLTLAATADELQVAPGGRLAIPLSISRAQRLQEPATLELVVGPKLQGLLSAEPATVQKSQNEAVFPIAVAADSGLAGEFPITVRATVLQDGKYPVVSEATILVTISSDSPVK